MESLFSLCREFAEHLMVDGLFFTEINKEGLMVETNYGCCGSKLSYADAIGLVSAGCIGGT